MFYCVPSQRICYIYIFLNLETDLSFSSKFPIENQFHLVRLQLLPLLWNLVVHLPNIGYQQVASLLQTHIEPVIDHRTVLQTQLHKCSLSPQVFCLEIFFWSILFFFMKLNFLRSLYSNFLDTLRRNLTIIAPRIGLLLS